MMSWLISALKRIVPDSHVQHAVFQDMLGQVWHLLRARCTRLTHARAIAIRSPRMRRFCW